MFRPVFACAITALSAGTALASGTAIPANQARPYVAADGNGLSARVWRDASVSSIGAAVTYTGANAPIGTFTSTGVDYPGSGDTVAVTTPLSTALGGDWASYVGGSPGSFRRIIMKFTGFIRVAEIGKYSFWVGSDDGFRLSIGGVQLGSVTRTSFDWTFMQASFPAVGLYPIELYYYANNTKASGVTLEWQTPEASDKGVITSKDLFVPTPGAAGLLAGLGLLAARRRR